MPRQYQSTLPATKRSENARRAAQARHSLDTYVNAIVKRAPELSQDQKAKLRSVLAQGRVA